MSATMLQVKQLLFMWMVVGNAILIVWSLVLYATGKNSGTLFFRLVVFLQVLVIIEVVAGVTLLGAGLPTNLGHLLYAFLNGGLALFRVLGHSRLIDYGRQSMMWQAILAFLAIGLIVRSSMTAHH